MTTMKFLITATVGLILSIAATAQVSKDSMNILKQQKQSLELSSKVNDQKMKLARLENLVDKKTREMESTAADAQKAADDNAEAANKLSGDAQDKTLARRAEKAGNEARKSAKRARSAADDLSGLKKDIESLKNKIADDEARLAANPVAVPVQ